MRPTQTKPHETPNPFTWRSFANVRMGDHLLGESTVDLLSLGFSGHTVPIQCTACDELLGSIPVELMGEEFKDLTTHHIAPVLAWHAAKHHA